MNAISTSLYLLAAGMMTAVCPSLFAGNLVNGGFESDFYGWNAVGNVAIQSAAPYTPTEGTRLVAFNSGNTTSGGVLSQTVDVEPGTLQRLEYDVGNLSYNGQEQELYVAVNEYVGGVFRPLVEEHVYIPGLSGGSTNWLPKSHEFRSESGSVTIVFGDLSAFTQATDLVLDHVRLDAVTPPDVAADQWEMLSPVGLPHGVSAGGGLATDGTFIYAADFIGDGNADFIDSNGNNSVDPGEHLSELGIATVSVRIARFDPANGQWQSLPSIAGVAWNGYGPSSLDFNGSLFCSGGYLYYYQLRSGPRRCVLHRYPLSSMPGGAWEMVWDKDLAVGLLDPGAGMTAIDTPAGPAILHHRGGGAYDFCRTSAITQGGLHEVLTPDWPIGDQHNPRNGSWEYDPHTGALYHMSGDQLLRWTPSASYPGGSFVTTVPVAGTPLAAFHADIASLKQKLGWETGGGEPHPGASLWGNSLTVVNDPSGNGSGPSAEDSGANVLYLVRGETSPDGWPFNAGRGQITNGDFARWFPLTGNAQKLASAPFPVGKGSDSVYLEGYLYLTQGETRNSADAPGNLGPVHSDGIRRPGTGFARFRIRPADDSAGDLVIPIADYVAGRFATVTASAPGPDSTANLFDRDWTSSLTVEPAAATITIAFSSPITVGAARAAFGAAVQSWTLDGANSDSDLAAGTGSFIRLLGPSPVPGSGPQWAQWNDTPVNRRLYRLTVQGANGEPLPIYEIELQRAKPIQTLTIGGVSVPVNHLEITGQVPILTAGQSQQLHAEASLSLGPSRYDVTSTAVWTSGTPAVVTVNAGLIAAVGHGQSTITATVGGLSCKAAASVPNAHDDDLSVATIQRLPVMDYVWNSTNPKVEGWPAVGSTVTWRAHVRNWWPTPRTGVTYRWLMDGAEFATGTVNLAASGLTDVDLPWTWTFDRHVLTFEIDPANAVSEFSETNNRLQTWTDAITLGFWVEQSLFDYFHVYQKDLGIGSNGWEDWAQRQVARWNSIYAAAVHPFDAPQGVLDRIRLDKITILPDGSLPLNGGRPTNHPDVQDRSVDLEWGFDSKFYLADWAYTNHTAAIDSNPFFYDGVTFHELGHARSILDVYGFNVESDLGSGSHIGITLAGQNVVATPYMPRAGSESWRPVFYINGTDEDSLFYGLMNGYYLKVDRYSTMAFNQIAGRRAISGNYNSPENIATCLNDLPAQNTVQLVDGHSNPIPGATVSLYRAVEDTGLYGKRYDDLVDATFHADANGNIEVGRNPFTAQDPIPPNPALVVPILRVDAGGKTGFAVLPGPLFNMEYWRGNTAHGHYELTIPMIGTEPEIVRVIAMRQGSGHKVQIIAGGLVQPESVTVGGVAANFANGSWWTYLPANSAVPSQVVATWTGGPTLVDSVTPHPPAIIPDLYPEKVPEGLRIGWWSRAGHRYQMEHSANLLDWTPAGATDRFGTGGWMEATDLTPAVGGKGFTRLRAHRLTE